ncbi:MAG TPA: HAMP domain-containing sensor histidine kinase [Candidatus Binatia bacterium]|jgi:signal transduction histidine kinase|nr:HAMP domain-containing sensor histidine kinase [Candidatus Binatia bacterium]
MRALRRRFLLVAVAVLVPVGLLVWRALASVAVEEQRRHEVVAERLFDEMERALSDLLVREDARPVDAALPDDTSAPWIVGWYDVPPDGRVVASPRLAAMPELVAAVGSNGRGPVPVKGQRPGSTVEVAGADAKGEVVKKNKAASPAYDALSSLNKAAEQRGLRQKSLADAYRSDVQQGARDDGVASARPPEAAPFVGRLADARHLVLSRTVIRADGRGGRQGLVLDVDALGARLRDQALAAGLERTATVTFATPDTAPSAPDPSTYDYRHRFAEPFDALTAHLALRPLGGFGSSTWIIALATLLLIAVVVGLVALYRMVAVAMGFAERRSNFVAAVTHELKTPLTAIRMYGEMLRDGIVPSEAKRDEYHRHITAESERLSRLIDNVLEFSRLERNARPMVLVAGAIGPVLEEAASMLRPHVERGGLSLRVVVDPALPPVRFERDALLQIVVNLVDNAVKYAGGAGPGEVVVHASRMDDGRVVLRVRDHGPGVPREHLGRVFEPFHRGERELTRRTKGTGLGLALVRSLTEAMGGRVRGQNLADGGFEVEVALPGAAAA